MLQSIGPEIWLADGEPVRWFTLPFPTRMTVVRLAAGELWVHSPIRLDEALRKAVGELGTVCHLVSPNKIHHLFLGEWGQAFPDARVYAPPALRAKRSDLVFHGDLADSGPFPWSGEIEQLVFGGGRFMDEVVFFHRPSRTLILGDLIENFDPASLSPMHRWAARFGKVLAPRGETPRDLRRTFPDHERAGRALDQMLDWAPQRIVLAHGIWVERDAQAFLERAFAWVRA